MPVGGPGYPSLSAPKTRVLQAWSQLWKQVFATGPRKYGQARETGARIRRLGARR